MSYKRASYMRLVGDVADEADPVAEELQEHTEQLRALFDRDESLTLPGLHEELKRHFDRMLGIMFLRAGREPCAAPPGSPSAPPEAA